MTASTHGNVSSPSELRALWNSVTHEFGLFMTTGCIPPFSGAPHLIEDGEKGDLGERRYLCRGTAIVAQGRTSWGSQTPGFLGKHGA